MGNQNKNIGGVQNSRGLSLVGACKETVIFHGGIISVRKCIDNVV